MKFVDIVTIQVAAGRGGNGCMSFRREKFVPKGGPDGGNGGRGGHIFLEATTDLHTLADFEYSRHISSNNGAHGQGARKFGANASDVVIKVPCGTIVFDKDTGEPLADLVEPGDRCLVARGGRGGKGNAHFANSRRRAPRFSEKGEDGEKRKITMELKLIADVALVGVPNAGKSSLLAAISNATPKIADYPFTTLSPNLGVMRIDQDKIVVADIPGLIEGAHQNKGLGHYFLRHIERTRVIVHVLDLSSGSLESVVNQWETVLDEFRAYNADLLERPYIVVGNKIDIDSGRDLIDKADEFFSQRDIRFIATSALTGEGVQKFMDHIVSLSREHPRPTGTTRLFATVEENLPEKRTRDKVQILKLHESGCFRVIHPRIEAASARYDFGQEEAAVRFMRILRQYKVEELLEASGAQEGDTIYIGDVAFEFQPERAY
ncbi:GTPase ObgE [Dethiosulfovibrio sp. F2B]|uniref:GTPase ObgE n=1 Tax=Dethiosulfovibrio faecalis TaxID=2720018 RepID=UPI001F26CF25|nr:GTPase ObgE [Dethiosulfovibrio faecalis]MCF4150513.1 GTPase ObgE [Dethiosulfovibrio faecalis]